MTASVSTILKSLKSTLEADGPAVSQYLPYVNEALSAAAAKAQGAEVAVKPLEWAGPFDTYPGVAWQAYAPFGSYYIKSVTRDRVDAYEVTYSYLVRSMKAKIFATAIEAQKEAQADYEKLISSALTTPQAPQPTEREKVLEEALRDLVSWFSGGTSFHHSLVNKAYAALAGEVPSQTDASSREREEG